MILLDTDIMIDVLRRNVAAITWMQSVTGETIALSGIVSLELLRGARNKDELRVVRSLLAPFKVFWPEPTDYEQATIVLVEHGLSNGIGILDALIGVAAVRLGEELLTFNDKHFKVIPGLVTRRPYSRT